MRIVRQSLLIAAMLFAVGDVRAEGTEVTYEWRTDTYPIYQPGSKSVVDGVTAYLIDADQLAQQKVLTDVVGGNLDLASYVQGKTAAVLSQAIVNQKGHITSASCSHPSQGTGGHGYFVLQMDYQVDGEDLKALYFSSDEYVSSVSSAGTATFVLSAQSSSTVYNTLMFQSVAGGWYIPEPSSGVLLLFGLAGLALRRRKI